MSTLDLHVEVGHPLVRGGLALYPLFGDGPVAPEYLPGPLAASAGSLRVAEREDGPSVPELGVTNAGLLPLLLVEGENLLGGWQNRTLNVSVLIAAGRSAAVPVSCVERGRWGGSREGARPAPAMSPSALRARKQRAVAHGVFAGAPERRSDQGEVWEAVSGYATRFEAAAPTEALADVQQARHGDVMAMVAGTRPLEGQRGVAVAIAGRVRSVDLFDRAATLAAYWDALVQGYALDAVGVEADSPPPGRRGVVQAFDDLRTARTRSVPGVDLGLEVHATAADLTAGALVWDDICVHLGLHRVPA
ncbi:MAG: hypothetical protein M3P85_00360 [Actinomycetota bacterium]|nr:hypothetical protein [Actinomycetota bacterium]